MKMLTPLQVFFSCLFSIARERVGVMADWIAPPTRRAKIKSGIRKAPVNASRYVSSKVLETKISRKKPDPLERNRPMIMIMVENVMLFAFFEDEP